MNYSIFFRMRITKPDKKIKSYLSLDQLGILLQKLSKAGKGEHKQFGLLTFATSLFIPAPVYEKRPLPEGLKQGEYNLLVVPPGYILYFQFYIYPQSFTYYRPCPQEYYFYIYGKYWSSTANT